jgi:uncharacterized membrane protein YqjE
MVWMVWDGMVINVWMVVGMMMMVLHAFWWRWFPSTHDNNITTSAIILVDIFFCWWRLSASRSSTARKQADYSELLRTLLNQNCLWPWYRNINRHIQSLFQQPFQRI